MDSLGAIIPIPNSTSFKSFINRMETLYLKSEFEFADFDDERVQKKALHIILESIPKDKEKRILESHFYANVIQDGSETNQGISTINFNEMQNLIILYDQQLRMNQKKKLFEASLIRF